VKLTATVAKYEVVGGSLPGQSGALDAIKARVSIIPVSGQHVEYTLRVQMEGKSWEMQKRFSDVAALHDVLSKRLHSVPSLPAKTVVRQFDPQYLEMRKTSLSSYFEQICRRRDVLNCVEVQQFFDLPEKFPNFRQPHASEPVQVAEVQEAAFGIKDISYLPIQGLMLIGATDCSWTSRIDTKITNIKLPWEPAAPNLPTSQMSLWRQSPSELRFDMIYTCRYLASISAVALAVVGNGNGHCLCGLSDGTVGNQTLKGELGTNNMGATLPLLRHTAAVNALCFDHSEQLVMSASKDSGLIVYDLRKQTVVSETQTPGPTTSMTYCEEQKRLFTGVQSGKVVVWDLSRRPIQQVGAIPEGTETLLSSRICALDYDEASSTLFAGTKEGLSLWNIKHSSSVWGRCVGQVRGMSHGPTAIAWCPSSREILAGFSNGAVMVFDQDTGEATYALQAHNEEVTAIVWLDAPRRLLTASTDKTVKFWDFPSLRRLSFLDSMPDLVPSSSAAVSSTSNTSQKGRFDSLASLGPNPLGGLGKASRAQDDFKGYPAEASATPAATTKARFTNPFEDPPSRSNANPFEDPPSRSTLPLDPLSSSASTSKATLRSSNRADDDDDDLRWDS